MIKWVLLSALVVNLLTFFWLSDEEESTFERNVGNELQQVGHAGEIVLLSELEVIPATRPKHPGEEALPVDESEENSADVLAVDSAEPELRVDDIAPQELIDNSNSGRVVSRQVGEGNSVEESTLSKELVHERELEYEAQSKQESEFAPEILCVALGRFDREHDARGIMEKLEESVGVAAKVNSAVEGLVRYLVYMPPFETRALAKQQQAEFEERGVRSSLYYKGDLQNGLSLGYFGSSANAERRFEALRKEGYGVELKAIETRVVRYWLEFQNREVEKLSQRFWQDMAKKFPNVTRREMVCSRLAFKKAE